MTPVWAFLPSGQLAGTRRARPGLRQRHHTTAPPHTCRAIAPTPAHPPSPCLLRSPLVDIVVEAKDWGLPAAKMWSAMPGYVARLTGRVEASMVSQGRAAVDPAFFPKDSEGRWVCLCVCRARSKLPPCHAPCLWIAVAETKTTPPHGR
jgi:hypothetical protein